MKINSVKLSDAGGYLEGACMYGTVQSDRGPNEVCRHEFTLTQPKRGIGSVLRWGVSVPQVVSSLVY